MKRFVDIRQTGYLQRTCFSIRIASFLADCAYVCPKLFRLFKKPWVSFQYIALRIRSMEYRPLCKLLRVQSSPAFARRFRISKRKIAFDRFFRPLAIE